MDWIAKLDALPDDERDLIARIAKTWLIKGEDPTIVAAHVRAWIGKNDTDSGGAGSRPPQDRRDPTQELEDLADAHAKAHGVSRSKAYSEILRSRPDLNRSLAQQRDRKLRKAAQAFGDGLGMR